MLKNMYMRMARLNGEHEKRCYEIKRLGYMVEQGWLRALDVIDRTSDLNDELDVVSREISDLAQEIRAIKA